MSEQLDLDALAAVVERMTPGVWCTQDASDSYGMAGVVSRMDDGSRLWVVAAEGGVCDDLESVCAIRNAAPALLAELRELRAYKERREREDFEVCENCEHYPDPEYPEGFCRKLSRMVQADETSADWTPRKEKP